ncbi:cyclin-dependent kinase-like 2 isoform X2 [Oryzias melastigma]|uniref:Cyclin-dependent kinase-like 2 n=1 Tax=Oryzias melastigma TaxID=30732 RepID=A0A3B3E0J8_ORYME|nr:cyclin-dependent kinase-like 2 isoform X2 [Oryzias melastigma]
MERYESLGPVGEGSYGTVLKCRHRESGRLVAIKKFIDSDDDKTVKKIALREIKLLRQLRHDNLVNLLEVWKRRHRWYLVFEFVDRTLLNDLEQNPSGLDLDTARQYLYQILRATDFCHQQNVIHRDIKPENILISHTGVVKLCDFGFARTMTSPPESAVYTDYVATRWYRAPELLVGDIKYGKPVDVWAVGCLIIEMLTSQPLFPGESDLDQIHHIVRCFGNLMTHHQELFYRNPVFSGVKLPESSGSVSLQQRFPTMPGAGISLAQRCLEMDPERRAQSSELLQHPLFTQDSFHIRFLEELNVKIQKEQRETSTLPKITKTPRSERDEKHNTGKDKKQNKDVDERTSKEKMEKTKGKPPLKIFKTRNTSEPLMSKQSKTVGNKGTHHSVMKSKHGKAHRGEFNKGLDSSKLVKIQIFESPDATKTPSSLKNKNPEAPTPKHAVHPHIKDLDNSESAIDKNLITIKTLSKSEASQEFTKSWSNMNFKVPQLFTPSSPKTSMANGTNTGISLKPLQLSNFDSAPTIPSGTKLSRVWHQSNQHLSDKLTADLDQSMSESPKVLQSNLKTPKTTSNSYSKSFCSSKNVSSEFSEQLSSNLIGLDGIRNPAVPSKRISAPATPKTGLSSKTLTSVRELKEENHGPDKSQSPHLSVMWSSSGLTSSGAATKDGDTSSSEPNSNPSAGTTISDKQDSLVLPASTQPDTKLPNNQTSETSGSSDESNKKNDDPKTSTRGFDLHDTTASTDFPPPPTPSSTPLLLPPSPTCPTSVFGISNNPDCDHLRPGIYNLRSADIPRDHIQPVDPLPPSYATTSVLHQASEDFSSNHRNLGNCSATLAKNQSQGNFPELRSSTLPELRGRDGKPRKGSTKDSWKN